MTPEEAKNNPDLLALCAKEVEEKVRAGQNPEQAKLEVFRAHGVEFDEDVMKAEVVGKMELSDEELKNVTGGTNWCVFSHACYYVYKHDDEAVHGDACLWDYECGAIYECDLSGVHISFTCGATDT